MSSVDDLREALEQLAADTEAEVATLTTSNQTLEDKKSELNAELDTSNTGRDVGAAFDAAITAVEEAIQKLTEAADKANDYAQALIDN